MNPKDYIEINPEIAFGKPVIKGTRIAVEFILDLYAGGWTLEEILEEYPQLTKEQVLSCFDYVKLVMEEQKTYKPEIDSDD